MSNLQTQLQPQSNIIQKGSIIVFPYMYWKNDPAPCVMVSSIDGTMVKGINLHYLTFAYVKRVLPSANPGFSYYNIKADKYIVSAFRSYLVRGIVFDKLRMIDSRFLLQVMTMVRSFDPIQIKALRQEIERQLYTGYPQPMANPTGPMPYQQQPQQNTGLFNNE